MILSLGKVGDVQSEHSVSPVETVDSHDRDNPGIACRSTRLAVKMVIPLGNRGPARRWLLQTRRLATVSHEVVHLLGEVRRLMRQKPNRIRRDRVKEA